MTSPLPPLALALSSGVDVGHAWLQHLARGLDVRILFLKGPALALQGLRAHRVSSDIDVLVDPDRFDDLCDELVRRGWRERPATFIAELTSIHSRTFLHDRWPCDIDVHRHYPGMLVDPTGAFEALWSERAHVSIGNQLCDVPGRLANIIVLALHSLRGTERQPRHASELAHLETVPLTPAERRRLGELAERTCTTVTLFDVLTRMGVPVTPSADDRRSQTARRWNERVASGSYGSYFWFAALRDARGIDRLRIGWRAVWPTRADLLLSRPETRDTSRGRLAARIRRWSRGARSVPRALRATGRRSRIDSIAPGGR